MEHVPEILKALAEYGVSPLNVVLLGMLYFMGAQHGTFPKFWEIDEENKGTTLADLHNQMASLKTYFNHETTERLDELSAKADQVQEGVETIIRKHDEYDKFGIKTRRNA